MEGRDMYNVTPNSAFGATRRKRSLTVECGPEHIAKSFSLSL